MAGRASAFVFVLIVLAIAAGGWFLFRGSAPPKAAPPDAGGTPAKAGDPPPARGKNPHQGPSPAVPLEAPVPATREGCLAFLQVQASPVVAPKGMVVPVLPSVRMDALDALAAVAPAASVPAVLAALGGDDQPDAWSEERLHAAWIRVRAGQADGAETVRAYLKGEESLADADATVEAARAATAMAPAEGAGVLRRILSEKADAFGEEVLAAVLQAAAALGDGATPGELRKHLESEEWLVRGAAAGALLRLGDDAGAKLAATVEWPDSDDFARGLGVAGNEAALPVLATLLKSEEPFIRAGAARAMGAVGGPKAAALLQAALKDPDADVGTSAAVALAQAGAMGDPAAVRRATADKDAEVAIAAWKALALAGDEGSRGAAEALLAVPPPSVKDGTRGLALQKRIWAAALIVKITK